MCWLPWAIFFLLHCVIRFEGLSGSLFLIGAYDKACCKERTPKINMCYGKIDIYAQDIE